MGKAVVLLQGIDSGKYGEEVEPFPPLLEQRMLPSKAALPPLNEIEGGWVSLPLNERKSVMPKLVAKQSSSTRGDNEMEVLVARIGKDSEYGKRRQKATTLKRSRRDMVAN